MPTKPNAIEDTEDAKQMVRHCVHRFGLGFHIDTPFADYVDANGDPILCDMDADAYERQMDAAYDMLTNAGADPYEIALTYMRDTF